MHSAAGINHIHHAVNSVGPPLYVCAGFFLAHVRGDSISEKS